MKTKNLLKILTLTAVVAFSAAPSLADEYSIDTAHSSVGFQIKHMTISKVNGDFPDFSGTISYDAAQPEALSADVVIQVASVTTGNEKRDTHLKSPDFFEVETFPTMTFKSTAVKMKNAEEGEVTGELTMHGATKPVTLDLTINGAMTDPWGNERVGASLSGTVNRKDWGLVYNKALETGGLMLGEDVKISIEIEAIKNK